MRVSKGFQNRAARRANTKTFKTERKIRKSNWGEWKDNFQEAMSAGGKEYIQGKKLLKNLTAFWVNEYVSVQVSKLQTEIGKVYRLGIRRHDESPNISWPEKQRIKNDLFGENAIAIEVFPRQDKLIDQANMSWLWIVPEDFQLPFSLDE